MHETDVVAIANILVVTPFFATQLTCKSVIFGAIREHCVHAILLILIRTSSGHRFIGIGSIAVK